MSKRLDRNISLQRQISSLNGIYMQYSTVVRSGYCKEFSVRTIIQTLENTVLQYETIEEFTVCSTTGTK